LPEPGAQRDVLMKRVMGTPDVMPIDGMSGSRLVTSKITIVSRSSRDDADVDYTFVQVDIERNGIGYDGNCGNISAGVGPFAIDEVLVEITEPVTQIRIFNTNTQKVLVAQVPVAYGNARVSGDCRIAGALGTGAICTTAASRVPGSVVFDVLSPASRASEALRIAHPLGVMSVAVQTAAPAGSQAVPSFTVLGFVRTARRLMTGQVHVPRAEFGDQ
jgi:hypothetical protein